MKFADKDDLLEEATDVIIVEPRGRADPLVFRMWLNNASVRCLADLSVAVNDVHTDS